jgi:SNF family Na+-dependent transporter
MKFATLYFMLFMLFLFLAGYESPPNMLHAMAPCSEVNTHHIESRAAFEKLPTFLDLSINLEEDEILDLIKKVSVYTVLFLFFTSLLMVSIYQEKMKLAKQDFSFRSCRLLCQIFRV